MKFIIIILLLIPCTFALDFNLDKDTSKTFFVEKNDVITLSKEQQINILRVTEKEILLNVNNQTSILEINQNKEFDTNIVLTLNSIDNNKAKLTIKNLNSNKLNNIPMYLSLVLIIIIFLLILYKLTKKFKIS